MTDPAKTPAQLPRVMSPQKISELTASDRKATAMRLIQAIRPLKMIKMIKAVRAGRTAIWIRW